MKLEPVPDDLRDVAHRDQSKNVVKAPYATEQQLAKEPDQPMLARMVDVVLAKEPSMKVEKP